MLDDYFKLEDLDNNTLELFLLNFWNKTNLTQIIQKLEKITINKNAKLCVNFQDLKECDSSAIIYLISFLKNFQKENITFKNFDKYEKIYNFYEKHYQDEAFEEKERISFLKM